MKENVINEETLQKIRKLNTIAQGRTQTLAQMALAWILRDRDITSVLIGASKASQIVDNIKMLDNLLFNQKELEAIDQVLA